MADVAVKDSSAVQHLINTDTNPDGSETQVVKLQVGNEGQNGGLVSGDNPLPVTLSVYFKRMFQIFGRMRFSSSSDLYVNVTSLPTLSTVSTVSTITTGNIGFGDTGKAATAMLTSQQNFQSGVGKNFVRS